MYCGEYQVFRCHANILSLTKVPKAICATKNALGPMNGSESITVVVI